MRSYVAHFRLVPKATIAKIVFALTFFLVLPVSTLAATLSFSPALGSYPVGSTVTVSVYSNSGGVALNALSGVVAYPNDLLEVISISKNQSIISLWVQEPSFSNSAGTINFEGIVLNPGYIGSNGRVLTITFRVKAAGQPTLVFSSGSILANDGEGSEILTSKGQAQFTTVPATVVAPVVGNPVTVPEQTTESSENETIGVTPQVLSDTHPQNTWSKETTGVFNFILTDEVTAVRLLIDSEPLTTPVITYAPPIEMREIRDLEDGVSYLHIQYKTATGWGEVVHYKLQIDTVVPDSVSAKELLPGIFLFRAHDSGSEISHYEVQIDGGETIKFIDDGSHVFATPAQTPGTHTLQVKAVDLAGNFTSTSLNFVTPASPSVEDRNQDLSQYSIFQNRFLYTGAAIITILSVVIPFIALILLLVILLYVAWRAHGGLKRHIDKEVSEAKLIVHKAFALLRSDLEVDIATLKKASSKRVLTREEAKILKRLQKNLDEAEEVIGKELSDIEKVADA